MRNYVHAGRTITVPSPADVIGGEGIVIGEIFGIVCGDAATGDELDILLEGVFEMAKRDGDEFAVGDPVYFLNGLATTEETGRKIGFAVKDGNEITVRLT
ncbi:DUF2190 family protein [Aurantimonas coralicida]|uniref:DUF2190 family protein n=1 Tax=Aurantimonas coralicida TaxID=182270 RepID=UPI0023A54289|nr:DUF2190 family protein [Aurantimonas coralicida]MDE0921806.1 DUF2190 family protein [Aurantimonas coralicida]